MVEERLGPYRIVAEVGSGGMGTVHLAVVDGVDAPLSPGRRVAIKVIHPHLVDRTGFLPRFAREAEIGRQVDHPHVVRTLDAGQARRGARSVPYLVMEHVAGRNLRTLLADLGTLPEALVREIGRQSAAGLEAIHAAGIIHRDLKPENILITDDHQVRIMDMGVARIVGESLTRDGDFAGSLFYAAPENFRDEDTGAPADLYALGVMLYELAVGANPFRGDTAAEVISAHLHHRATPASESHARLSPFFSEVLDALLAKRPEDRISSAADLRRILERGERSRWWAAREARLLRERRRVPRVPVRRETRLHGRRPELRVLVESWRRAKTGRGGVVHLEGEAGIGKSRLVDAFLERIASRDVHVLYGSYAPSGGLGGLSDAVRSHFGLADVEEAIRPYLPDSPSLAPALAALARNEVPPPDAEPIEGDTLHALLCQVMRSLAVEKPVIWVVEDLHFATGDSHRIVTSLARATAGHRVLLLLTTRPGRRAADAALAESVPGLRRLRLGRLGPREVIELLRDAVRSESLAEALGGKIAYRSDGVPLFVLEMIHELRDRRLLRQQADGSWAATATVDRIEVPSAIRSLVEARLQDLDDEDRSLLDLAAVIGFEFDPDLLARVRGARPIVVLERLAALERRTGVVRGEGRLFRFDHHQIQEVLESDLHEALRTEYHAALAEAFAARVGMSSGERPEGEAAAFLARHHLLGTRPRMGLPHLPAALEHLGRTYGNERALDLARHALETPDLLRGRARADVLMRVAARLGFLGRRREEREALEEAIGLADREQSPTLRARSRTALGFHLYGVARYAEAEERLVEALALARQAGDRRMEGDAIRGLGAVLWMLGRRDEARVHRETALAIARETGDRRAEARATGNLGNLEFYLDRYDEARRCYERELSIAREIGDRRGIGVATGSLGLVDARFGLFDSARGHHECSLAVAREIGDRRGEAAALGNLGNVLQKLGRDAEALRCRERHLDIAREIGDRHFEAIALTNLGALRSRLGDPETARTLHESGKALCERIGTQRPLANAELGLGDVAAQVSRLDEARDRYESSVEICREIGHRRGVADGLVSLARVLPRRGRCEDAVRVLWRARRIGRELGSPETTVLAACGLARLGALPVAIAEREIQAHSPRLGVADMLEARFLLWKAAGDRLHLEAAHRCLERLVRGAPEDDAEAIVTGVPLHAELRSAWIDHGAGRMTG